MIKHIWTVICSRSTIDKDTNNISLIDVIERLSFTKPSEAQDNLQDGQKVKVVVPQMEIVTLWGRETDQKEQSRDIKLYFVNPQGEKTAIEATGKVVFTKGIKRMRVRIKVPALELSTEGIYKLVTSFKKGSKWEVVDEIPLEVEIKKRLNESLN